MYVLYNNTLLVKCISNLFFPSTFSDLDAYVSSEKENVGFQKAKRNLTLSTTYLSFEKSLFLFSSFRFSAENGKGLGGAGTRGDGCPAYFDKRDNIITCIYAASLHFFCAPKERRVRT